MKKVGAAILLLTGILLVIPGRCGAETRTISWSAVTTYTDNTPIEPTKTVMYSVYWSTDAALASLQTIASSIAQTSRTFDPDALGIPRGQPAYFTVETVLSTGEKSALAPAYPWTPPALISLSISGPSSVNENGSGTYTATAAWNDGSTTPVTPGWTDNSAFATISAGGVLTAATVTMNQTVMVTASYTSGGVNRTATKDVTIVDVAAPGVLSVSPAGGLTSSGTAGGPFTPASQAYTLTNSGGTPINWTASKTQSWVTLSLASGTLAAGTSTTVTVSFGTGANSLAAGSYSDTVTFTNATNGSGNTTRAVSLTVAAPGAMSVSPAGGLTSTGTAGGPFTPASQAYTLTNSGGTPINWTAGKTQSWVTLSLASGTLAAGASTTVTVSFGTGANSLAAGSYSDTVTFTNATNVSGNTTRSVSLTVSTPQPVPAAPMNLILEPVQTTPSKLFRLAWDNVTRYTDNTAIGTVSVTYSAYWTTDETLSAGTLRALATSIPATSVTFDPAAAGMIHNQRVYLTVRATLSTGPQSALAEGLSWVAINEGPVAPSNPTIIRR